MMTKTKKETKMIAQYTATKKTKTLSISESRVKPVIKIVEVTGKVQAKKICKKNNITPWNF